MPRTKSSTLWTDDEVETLVEHYHEHGPRWDGWSEYLPHRTYGSIVAKAWALGIRCDPNAIVRNYGMEPTLAARIAVSSLDDATKTRLIFLFKEES